VTWQFAYKFAAAYAQVVYVSFFPRFSSVTTRAADTRVFHSADKTITMTQTRKFLIESLRLASVYFCSVARVQQPREHAEFFTAALGGVVKLKFTPQPFCSKREKERS
jgi:hypothetical protein